MEKAIRTERLEINRMSEEDGQDLSQLLLNEQIKKTFVIPDFEDREALDGMVKHIIKMSCSDDHFTRGIYLDKKLIGFVNDVDIVNQTIELGYVIDPAFWGKGYATEMLRAVIDCLLGRCFTTIRTGAFLENAASIRVMEKSGMTRCQETENITYRGGEHTCIYYEIKV